MPYLDTVRDAVQDMIRGFMAHLPKMAIALAILVLTWIVARFAVRIAERLIGNTHLRESLKQLVETLVRLAIWLTGLLIAAAVVFPGFTPAGLIAGLGIGAVAIGFAFQDIFENFLAGVLIMLREKMRIGDLIEVEGIMGKVEKITLRESHVRQLSNELTILPNAMLFKNPVKIFTDEAIRRDEIMVGVSYDTDLPQAMDVIRKAVESCEAVMLDKGVGVFCREFGASSIDFLVQFWTESKPRDMRLTRTEVVFAIKQALDEAGIEIPFPYVTQTFKEPLALLRAQREDTREAEPAER